MHANRELYEFAGVLLRKRNAAHLLPFSRAEIRRAGRQRIFSRDPASRLHIPAEQGALAKKGEEVPEAKMIARGNRVDRWERRDSFFHEGNFKLAAGRWSRDCVLHVEEPRTAEHAQSEPMRSFASGRVKDYLSESKACREPGIGLLILPRVVYIPILAPSKGSRLWPRGSGSKKATILPGIALAHKRRFIKRLLLEAMTHA